MTFFQFYYPKRLSFCPDDYETGGLGGGESAIVLVSQELAARGHRVEVYNSTWQPKVYNGVNWIGAWELPYADRPDVWVSVRFKQSVAHRGGKCNLFWMLDDRPAGAVHMLNSFSDATVLVASNAMKSRLPDNIDSSRIATIPLPVDSARYTLNQAPSNSMKCLHSSMPNRGLVHFFDVWSQVKNAVPDAELLVTSGWKLWGYEEEEERDRWHQILPKHLPSGVSILGAIPKADLISIQSSCRLAVFPSIFPEMFCLAAAEAASAGRPTVASSYEALKERVSDLSTGYLVDGDISSSDVKEKFANRIIRLYQDDELCDKMGAEARQLSSSYDIKSVVDYWEYMFAH